MFSNALYKSASRSKMLSRFKSAVSIQQQQEGRAVATATQSVPVANALLAAAAGILTVSGAAAVVERSTASTVPKFPIISSSIPKNNYYWSNKTPNQRFKSPISL